MNWFKALFHRHEWYSRECFETGTRVVDRTCACGAQQVYSPMFCRWIDQNKRPSWLHWHRWHRYVAPDFSCAGRACACGAHQLYDVDTGKFVAPEKHWTNQSEPQQHQL